MEDKQWNTVGPAAGQPIWIKGLRPSPRQSLIKHSIWGVTGSPLPAINQPINNQGATDRKIWRSIMCCHPSNQGKCLWYNVSTTASIGLEKQMAIKWYGNKSRGSGLRVMWGTLVWTQIASRAVQHNAKARGPPVGRTKDKRKGLSSSTTMEDWQMAVVSHLLKLADGHKRQSEASRWLSFTCHLNRPVLNQIITKAPDSAHQDTNPSLCPRMGEIERQESGTMEAISTRMAWYGHKPAAADLSRVSYQLWRTCGRTGELGGARRGY